MMIMIEMIVCFILVMWLLFHIVRGLVLIEKGENPYEDNIILWGAIVALLIAVGTLIVPHIL